MIRLTFAVAIGVALAACAPPVPESGRGVGFGDQFAVEQRARDAYLANRQTIQPPASVGTPVPLTPQPAAGSAEATALETTRVLDATRPGAASGASNGVGNDALTNSGVVPVQASPSNPAPPVLNAAGISDENNFDAVSGQRSIESDAARIASNSAQYKVVQPEALPDRSEAGPNIVAFALQTRHARGTKVYRRSFTRAAKTQRACAAFRSADQAQIDFLSRGGPERDRAGMDPDGDGFACSWDPTSYRRAAQQG